MPAHHLPQALDLLRATVLMYDVHERLIPFNKQMSFEDTQAEISSIRQTLIMQLGIDDAFLAELLNLFASSLPEVVIQLKSALAEQDHVCIIRAYKIHGEAVTFRLSELVTFLEEIECTDHLDTLPCMTILHKALTNNAEVVQLRLSDLQEAL